MSDVIDEYADKMKFDVFRWLENPENFGMRAICAPEYQLNEYGSYDYTGMGPLCRIYFGSGVFCGEEAVQQFNALAVLMATRREAELYHPVWGTVPAMLTDLQMTQRSRPDYIEYSFTFRATDERGSVPRLPENENLYE